MFDVDNTEKANVQFEINDFFINFNLRQITQQSPWNPLAHNGALWHTFAHLGACVHGTAVQTLLTAVQFAQQSPCYSLPHILLQIRILRSVTTAMPKFRNRSLMLSQMKHTLL